MPTLSEMNEHAADAEHQAFQRAYDALLDIAKDPITCRHFWDAGFTAGQADANDMLTVAHMDGYSKGRDAMRAELMRQEPVACMTRGKLISFKSKPIPDECFFYAQPMPPPDVRELVEALESFPENPNPYTYRMAHAKARAALAKFGGGV